MAGVPGENYCLVHHNPYLEYEMDRFVLREKLERYKKQYVQVKKGAVPCIPFGVGLGAVMMTAGEPLVGAVVMAIVAGLPAIVLGASYLNVRETENKISETRVKWQKHKAGECEYH